MQAVSVWGAGFRLLAANSRRHLSLSVAVSPSLCLCCRFSVPLSLSLSICPSVSVAVSLSLCLCGCLSLPLSLSLSFSPTVSVAVSLTLCLCISLPRYLCRFLSLSLTLSLSSPSRSLFRLGAKLSVNFEGLLVKQRCHSSCSTGSGMKDWLPDAGRACAAATAAARVPALRVGVQRLSLGLRVQG